MKSNNQPKVLGTVCNLADRISVVCISKDEAKKLYDARKDIFIELNNTEKYATFRKSFDFEDFRMLEYITHNYKVVNWYKYAPGSRRLR